MKRLIFLLVLLIPETACGKPLIVCNPMTNATSFSYSINGGAWTDRPYLEITYKGTRLVPVLDGEEIPVGVHILRVIAKNDAGQSPVKAIKITRKEAWSAWGVLANHAESWRLEAYSEP